jgi:hypothetical protein
MDEMLTGSTDGKFLDFGDFPADDQLIPAGNYIAEIVEIEYGETSEHSKSAGAPKFDIAFRITRGPHKGYVLRRVYVITEKATVFFRGLCAASGKFTDDELRGGHRFSAGDFDDRLIGAAVVIQVEQKTSRFGRPSDGLRNEVGRAYGVNSPVGKQVTAELGPAADSRLP